MKGRILAFTLPAALGLLFAACDSSGGGGIVGASCDRHADCGDGLVCDITNRCIEAYNGVNGVTATELTVGNSCGYLTGGTIPVSLAIVNGVKAYINHVNVDLGGIHGRQVKLDLRDDGYDPAKTTVNTTDMVTAVNGSRPVFGLIGYCGSPGSVAAYPIAVKNKTPFMGAVSGVPDLRKSPPDRYVFNYRASYGDQAANAARWMMTKRAPKIHPRNVAVFAQGTAGTGRDTCSWNEAGAISCNPDRNVYAAQIAIMDAFGSAGFDGVKNLLRDTQAINEWEVLFATHERNKTDVSGAVTRFLQWLGRPKPATEMNPGGTTFDAAIILQVVTDPAVELVAELRDQIASAKASGTVDATYGLSAAEVTELAKIDRLLFAGTLLSGAMGTKFLEKGDADKNHRYCADVLAIQVVPPLSATVPLITEYQAALAALEGGGSPDTFSLEGYIASKIFFTGLDQLGKDITTEAFVDQLESMSSIDIGLGVTLGYSDKDHQASKDTWAEALGANCAFAPTTLE